MNELKDIKNSKMHFLYFVYGDEHNFVGIHSLHSSDFHTRLSRSSFCPLFALIIDFQSETNNAAVVTYNVLSCFFLMLMCFE